MMAVPLPGGAAIEAAGPVAPARASLHGIRPSAAAALCRGAASR